MALVTTTVSPTVRITPFTGLSESVRERSGIARAEVVYSAYGTWPSTGVGDSRSISFLYTFSPNHGYVLMDANAAFIINADYMDMDATGVMEIETSLGTGDLESAWYQYENTAARQDGSGNTDIGSVDANSYNSLYPVTGSNAVMAFTMVNKPTGMLYPFPGVDDITSVSMFAERVANQPAMAYRFYARYLQYDITQGYNYVVNSPVMTR